MYNELSYARFASNIKASSFDYVGFDKLQRLVKKFKVCKNICKVLFELRQTLRAEAANAVVYEDTNGDGTKTITVNGDLILLNDIIGAVQNLLNADLTINKVVFNTTTFIADSNLDNSEWHAIFVTVLTTNFVVPQTTFWDVSALTGKSKYFTISEIS